MGVNTVETALFENALVVVKKPVLQVIEKRYLSNIKKKHNKQTYLTFSYLKILNKKKPKLYA
jgi:hypothetical protein